MSYRDWREKHETRLSPTERVVLILMLIAILVLVAYRIFDAVPKAESGIILEQASSAAPAEDAPVDLNAADRAALLTLPGIGESKADAILAYREGHGPFKNVDELCNVKGIGPAIVDGLRDRVIVRWVIEVNSSD